MFNDPIADMLTRVRNAVPRGHKDVSVPYNKLIKSICDILEKEGFISSYEIVDGEKRKQLKIDLKYINGQNAISHLERISKPGLRVYMGYKELKPVRQGLGISILSTSKGIMSNSDAFKSKIGGEILAKIW